jgi:hypothetical protein
MQFERPRHFSNFQSVYSFSYSIAIHAGKWQNKEKAATDIRSPYKNYFGFRSWKAHQSMGGCDNAVS